ncbi:MAG: FAD-dependent monooxygenase [Aeromicrobium erythreum]
MELVVAGSGLAGLAFAASARRLGVPADVTLLDERPALGGGAAITLAPNALAALDHVGLGDAVRAVGAPADAATVRRPDGSVVRSIDARRTVALLGEPVRVVDRGTLQHLLLDEVGVDRVRLGAPLVGVRQDESGVEVRLADGTGVAADALVGADGFRSAVARTLDPAVTATYAGYTAWRGVVDVALPPDAQGVVWGDRCEGGLAPMTDGRTYWFATAAVPADRSEDAGLWPQVETRLRTWGAAWTAVVDTLDGSPGAPLPLMDRSGPRRWSDGRVVVLGDAAHPMQPALGQGGAQALVDAVTLAVLLAEGLDPRAAFARFASRRPRQVRPVVAASRRAGRALHGDRPADRLAHRAAERLPQPLLEHLLRRVASRSAWRAPTPPRGSGRPH